MFYTNKQLEQKWEDPSIYNATLNNPIFKIHTRYRLYNSSENA